MAITLHQQYLPGTKVYVVPRPHTESDQPAPGPVLAQGKTDKFGRTVIPDLFKAGQRPELDPDADSYDGDRRYHAPLPCAVVGRENGEWKTVGVMVGLTEELHRRVVTSDGPSLPEDG